MTRNFGYPRAWGGIKKGQKMIKTKKNENIMKKNEKKFEK